MSRLSLAVAVGAVLVVVSVPATAAAQIPAHVRVVNHPARIQRWLIAPSSEVLAIVDPGTVLDVLDREKNWFWIIAPPDVYGTRRGGWIRTGDVEAYEPPAAATALAAPEAPAPAESIPPPASVAEDKVTISEVPATASAVSSDTFEDVHFDRDRSSLRAEDMDALRAAVAALKANPSLVVNIEGHTCNLGSTAYNLALGARRADAVKSYLVGEGIAADRLHTMSLGEKAPKYDNSREETRRLNRRVALVPDANPDAKPTRSTDLKP